MDELFNEVGTILRQEAFDLRPKFQAELQLSNRIDWAFAILFGQAGGLQVPLACTAAGLLGVQDDSLVSSNDKLILADYFDKTLSPLPLYSDISGIGIADYFDSASHYPPLYDSTDDTALADIMDGILTILTDVHDVGTHAIRTVAAT